MDAESFHSFYEQTARNLRGYLRSMLNNKTMVDDLLQESYFRLLNANLPASTDPAHRKNYLYRIATNLVHDHRRSRKLDEPPEDLTAAPSPDNTQDIAQAFARLKPKDRDILWMAYVECFSHKEIADVLRLGAANIRRVDVVAHQSAYASRKARRAEKPLIWMPHLLRRSRYHRRSGRDINPDTRAPCR